MTRDLLLRWLGPPLLALLVMLGYQVFIAPMLGDLLADWAFLHEARMQAIQQARQQQRPAAVPKQSEVPR